MTTYLQARLEAFKSGTRPYGQSLPRPNKVEQRQLTAAIAKAGCWRMRSGYRLRPEQAEKRLWRAALSLVEVYGEASGSEAVRLTLRGAKALAGDRRRPRRPLCALLLAVKSGHCAVGDVVEAILAMPGARSGTW